MPRKVLYRPKAETDLGDIWSYTVSAWSEAQAVNYLEGLDAAFTLLSDFPEISRLRSEFTPAVRIYTYRSHLVIYASDDASIEVIRILHTRSDWMALLSE